MGVLDPAQQDKEDLMATLMTTVSRLGVSWSSCCDGRMVGYITRCHAVLPALQIILPR